MRHTRLLSLLFFGVSLFAQGTPSITFTQSFTSASAGTPVSNGPTVQGGPQGSVGFRLIYYIQPGTGTVSALSVELDGAATSGGSYTALTPAVGGGSGSGSTTNPVTTFPQGQGVMCCDFYPFLKITINTLTVASGTPVLIVKVFGYAGTSASVGTGGGGGGGGTVTHTVGPLTKGLPVVGNGGGDITVGTATTSQALHITRFATAEVFSPGVQGLPAIWDAAGALLQGSSTGEFIPGGGTTGQVLTKNSNTDWDTSWTFPGVWTYGAATGAGDLFLLTDTASNTGTGFIQHITTASGSAASPWKADANGVGCSINSVGLFNCTPGSGIASGEAALMNFGPQGVVTTQFVGNTFQSSGVGAGRFTNDTGFPSFTFGKSRATTIGSQTTVQNGDGLGAIIFAGSDGANFIKSAEILVQASGSISTGIVPGSMVFQTANASGVNTTAGTINSAQLWTLVGPLNALHIAGNGASPTVAAGGAIGTVPTIAGTDFVGTVSVPSSAVTTGTIATVTFGTAYGVAPHCLVTQNGGIVSIGVGHGTPGTGSFTITAAIANVSATAYSFDYACSGN